MENESTMLTSTSNPIVKQVVQWQERSRARKKDGVFVVEGQREINLALKADYKGVQFFQCSEINSSAGSTIVDSHKILEQQQVKTYEVSAKVYKKIAYRNSTEGLVGVFKSKQHLLEDLHLNTKNPLILVAEAPEKPGNIGALLRTADAAGVDAFILADPVTDLYNPNIIRSSVGGVFTTPIATGTTREIIGYLKEQNISIYSAILQQALPYTQVDYNDSSALVVGTEADGLSEPWRKASKAHVKIPMYGIIDSMNVSVSAGILIYEALRQRRADK